jgi:hypothetical protein
LAVCLCPGITEWLSAQEARTRRNAMNPPANGAVYITTEYHTARLGQEVAMANTLQSLKTRTSIVLIAVIAVALVCACLLGGELYARRWAQSLVTAMVECAVDDDASVSIASTPPYSFKLLRATTP